MPRVKPKTKTQKKKVVKSEMHKFKEGKLHSGSKKGPIVTNPKQALAISMHVANIKPKKKKNRSGKKKKR